MEIDDLKEAQDLSARLEATIPFSVRVTKQLLKIMKERGDCVSLDDIFTVDWVKYSGDVGGISCAFECGQDKQRYAVSLTQVKIDPEHPLASEIVVYQERRMRLLELDAIGGFAAELLANSSQPKRKKSKGFGQK